MTSFENRAGGHTPGLSPKERDDNNGNINYQKTASLPK